MLPWIPRLVHTPATVDLSLPLRPWVPESTGVGGYEESAAGIGSAWEYRRDEALRLRLRAWEYEWPAVRDWIAAGQRAQSIEINLCQVGPSTPVRLVSPRMGEPIVPTLTETPGVWEVEVVVRPVSGTLYEPYYDELSGVNLLRNPGFEAGGDYWGVPLSTSWLGPGAGAEVTLADGGPTGTKTHVLIPNTPITDFGLTVGSPVAARCEMICDAGARGAYTIAWRSADGIAFKYDSISYTGQTWNERTISGRTVPEGAVLVNIYYQAYDTGTVRFRNATFGPGATAPLYLSAAVRQDPAGAHGGNRYLEVTKPAGAAQVLLYARDADGAIMEWPVRAGEQYLFGGWVRRVTGDAATRPWLGWYRDGVFLSISSLPSATTGEWELHGQSASPPVGATHVRFGCQIGSGGTLGTTARFDDVYLRIKRGGPR